MDKLQICSITQTRELHSPPNELPPPKNKNNKILQPLKLNISASGGILILGLNLESQTQRVFLDIFLVVNKIFNYFLRLMKLISRGESGHRGIKVRDSHVVTIKSHY